MQEIADIVSALASFYQGNIGTGMLSLASALPAVGQVPGAVKLVVKLEKILATSTRSLRRLRAFTAALRSWLGRALGLAGDALRDWLRRVGDDMGSLASAVAERLGVAPEAIEVALRQAEEVMNRTLDALGSPRPATPQYEWVRIDGRRGPYPDAAEGIDSVEFEWKEQRSRYADPADLDGPPTSGRGGAGGHSPSGGAAASDATRRLFKTDPSRRAHILDQHGPGRGVPGEREFSEWLSDDEIIDHIERIASDPNSFRNGIPAGPGSYRGFGSITGPKGETIRVMIWLEPQGRGVMSGFPLDGPINPRR